MSYAVSLHKLQDDKRDGTQQTERDLALFCRDIVGILGLHNGADQEISCHTEFGLAAGA